MPQLTNTCYTSGSSVPTVYCSGVAFVRADGPNLVFAVYQKQIAADGTADNIITANVVIPRDAWIAARGLTEFEIATSNRAPGEIERMMAQYAD